MEKFEFLSFVRVINDIHRSMDVDPRIYILKSVGNVEISDNGCWIQRNAIRYEDNEGNTKRLNPGSAKTFAYEFLYGVEFNSGFKFSMNCSCGERKCINPYHFKLNLLDSLKYKDRNIGLTTFFNTNKRDFDMAPEIDTDNNSVETTQEQEIIVADKPIPDDSEPYVENIKEFFCDECGEQYEWNKSRYCSLSCALLSIPSDKSEDGCFIIDYKSLTGVFHDEKYSIEDAMHLIKFGKLKEAGSKKVFGCRYGEDCCINQEHYVELSALDILFIKIINENDRKYFNDKISEMIISRLCKSVLDGKSSDELLDILNKVSGLKR